MDHSAFKDISNLSEEARKELMKFFTYLLKKSLLSGKNNELGSA